VGELYLGGAQLARGYLGRPGLTAERFVPDPWGVPPGGRLYRTGDLVRRRPDEFMEFVGRRDRQVKVRGVRIELGEVELHVNACDGVVEAAVTAEPHDGGRRLVAHVAGAVDLKAIRHRLEALVPRHLVPSTFVLYETLPRTRNGKIDYAGLRSLPEPPGGPVPAGRDPTAALYPGSAALARAVHEILGVWPARDTLLDLGADSLDAMRIVARLRGAGIDVDSRALLTTPLPELRLARLPEAARPVASAPAPSPPDDGPVPATRAQAGIWHQQLPAPSSTAYLVPVRLELEGPLEPDRLRLAWAQVVRRHDALRSRLAVHGGRAFLAPQSAPPPLAVHDLTGFDEAERDAEADRILARAASEPFPLTAEAPFRLVLVRMSRFRHVLGLTAHHVLCDGWSLALLVWDLGVAYDAVGACAPEPWGQPASEFATYARRHAAEVAAGRYDAGVRFWRDLLPEPPSPWPATTAARATGVALGRIFEVGEEPTGLLRACCRRWRVTLFVALLAGFATGLAARTGRTRVVVGVVTANRSDRELEDVVGHFVNTLPLPITVDAGRDRTALIASVDRVVRTSSPHWEVPLPLIAAALPRAGHGTGSGTGGPWNAVFELDSMPAGRFEAEEVTGQLSDEGLQQGAISALSLRVVERGGSLRCVLVADAAVMTGQELAGIEQEVLRAWRWLAG
jgi:aryl carrier-like protein